jgi:diguanylate cyclase (GGDEF)-like protein
MIRRVKDGMSGKRVDLSARGWQRVVLFTAVGTIACSGFSFVFDSYSFQTGTWRWGETPLNNLFIPLALAPPFFVYLLSNLRELAIAHHELSIVASTDSLTSCLNRRAFTTLVDGYLERVDAAKREGALLVIDVDHFKRINDSYGHDRGDEALRLIAHTIRGAVRDIDLVGRMGGEEFGVFLPGIDPDRTLVVAERIRATINTAEFCPGGSRVGLSVSVGGATFADEVTFTELFRRADQRLYAAKQNGRNRVDVNQPPTGDGWPLQIVH